MTSVNNLSTDRITGAAEYKVWSGANGYANYFNDFTKAFIEYQTLDKPRTLESVFTVLAEDAPEEAEENITKEKTDNE